MRETRFLGDYQCPSIGGEVVDIEGSRNSPLGRNGDVVGIQVDFAPDLERTVSARVELMCSFCDIALRVQSDHNHAPLLNLARPTVGFNRRFDLGVVGRDLVVDVSMEFREIGGVGVGFVRICSRFRKVDEVDR